MQNSHTPSPPAVVKSYIQTLDARQPQSALAQESRLPDFAAASMMAGISLQHLLPFDIACEQAPYILLVSNSPGGEVLKILSVGHRLNLISRIQGNNTGQELLQF